MTPAGVWSVVSATRDTWHRVTALLHLTPGCDTISAVVRPPGVTHRHTVTLTLIRSLQHFSLTICCGNTWHICQPMHSVRIWMTRHRIFRVEFYGVSKSLSPRGGGYRGCGGGAVLIVVAVRRSQAQWNIFIASIRCVLHRTEPDLSSAFSAALVLVFVIMFSLLRTPGRGSRGQVWESISVEKTSCLSVGLIPTPTQCPHQWWHWILNSMNSIQ